MSNRVDSYEVRGETVYLYDKDNRLIKTRQVHGLRDVRVNDNSTTFYRNGKREVYDEDLNLRSINTF